jgi:hypothetical protein
MKNAVFWDVMPCDSCESRSVLQFLVAANVVPSSLILFILIMEDTISSETSVFTIAMGVTSKKTEFFIDSGCSSFSVSTNRNTAVDVGTGCKLNGREDRVGIMVPSRISSSQRDPFQFWCLPSILSRGYRVISLRR